MRFSYFLLATVVSGALISKSHISENDGLHSGETLVEYTLQHGNQTFKGNYIFDLNEATPPIDDSKSLFFQAAEASKIVNNDYEDDEETLYKMNYLSDMDKPGRADLMNNKKNSFYFMKEKKTIYYDHEREDWYLLELNTNSYTGAFALPEIPVSACMDSSYGSGGSISRGYEISFSIDNSLTASGSYNISNIILGANLGISVGTSFTYSGSFDCSVGPGEMGQMFIQPFSYEVPAGRRRTVAYKKFRGIVAKGAAYEEIAKFKRIAFAKPNHSCRVVTEPSTLQCSAIVGGS